MRKLNKKQKDILKILKAKGVDSVEDMALSYFEELKALNDYETLFQDINRFLSDLEVENENKQNVICP